MRIFITGAGGGVGRALADSLAPRHAVTAYTHAQLDVTEEVAVRDAVRALRPDVIINGAAMADVGACERAPERAWQVNALAPRYLASAAADAGAALVHFSTDYVFDGEKGRPYTETDQTRPLNRYGESKAAGEQFALAHCPHSYVVRPAWIMNPRKAGFLNALIAAAPSGKVSVNGQTSSPTGLTDLVDAVTRLIATRPPSGIYHLVNAGCCSRAEMAREVYRVLDVQVAITDQPLHAPGEPRRPLFSALVADAWAQQGMPPMRPWQEPLAEVVRALTQR